VHYALGEAVPYYAWIIKPAEDARTPGAGFEEAVATIFRSEPSPIIKHVCVGASHREGALQEEVISQLKDTMVIKRYPTRHDSDGRMYLDGTTNRLSQAMCRLVYTAILNTSVVSDMNRVLNKHGLHVERVSTEKLFITADKGKFRWDAITWLIIGRTEQSAAPLPSAPAGPSEGAR